MQEIRIPRLGWSMEEGTFVGWLKQPGDEVAIGQPLFELEGEKALQEVESVDAGILHIVETAPQPGAVVPVGTLLGFLLAPGESPPSAAIQAPQSDPPPVAATLMPAVQPIVEMPKSSLPHAAPPSVRRLARQLGVNLDVMTFGAKAGRVTGEDLAQLGLQLPHAEELPLTVDYRERLKSVNAKSVSGAVASPRAKRVASELGVDWTTLIGTGRDGRVREPDVRGAVGQTGQSGLLTPRRKAIAERLRISRDRTIPVTLTTAADATNLVGLREQFKSSRKELIPTYADIVACLAARVLKRHAALARRWDEHHQSLISVKDDALHIGIAVDTPDGLLVPVIRDVGRKPLLAVVAESRRLTELARGGRLTGAEMQGGVFTISNLGGHEIDAFTPIINYPEIAVLGMGAIRREPIVLPDDRIVPGHRLTLSLTFDHAAIDGAPAAAFLRDLASAVKDPAAQLLDH